MEPTVPVTVGIVLISFALTFNSAVRLFVSTVSTLLWTWFPKNIGRALEKRTERNTRAMRRREVDEENKRWVALGPFSRTKEGSGGWAV
jgi:hypothetical protein